MLKYFAGSVIMHRNAAVISVTCILLCLTFNYTFPLHRDINKWKVNPYDNLSRICDKSEHHDKMGKQNKNMITGNLEVVLNKIKGSTQDFSKNLQARFNSVKNAFTEEDLRQYEQLVIMKKNPYLDLKEIEFRYSPNEKAIRQSTKFDTEPLAENVIGDPSIWEAMEDGLSVEITNRGLTGFAIPAKIVKASIAKQNKLRLENLKAQNNMITEKDSLKFDKSSGVFKANDGGYQQGSEQIHHLN